MKRSLVTAYLGFSYVLGIGPMKFASLVAHFGNAEKAYRANLKQLQEILGLVSAEAFYSFRNDFSPEKELDRLEKQSIHVIPQISQKYPPNLLSISDSPICLFAKGDPSKLFPKKIGIAVVGTRKPTAYGIQVTKRITSDLADYGATIVSGMALGIDAEAHKAALDNEAPTVAVLGCGVNIPYPAANKWLYDRILKEGGVIVSEFPPDRTVLPGLFISRNRIISGLSQGVLITEGLKDSGALITASYAANQGRDVFAVPSPITSNMSEAPHILLKQGAKLVTSAQDILEEYNISVRNSKQKTVDFSLLNSEERSIVQALLETPFLIDDLIVVIDFPVSQTLQVLSRLELKGIVEKNSEGKYQIA
ncbi:DNA protecting protein DprA [Candidatus Roizmanbacteria bacterium RIFCSPLOWO2_01_FULL_40_42]|uniref:DNA protecting protein DprA n=1 Tax=Candidatus Roizmanbacteria bacterium RIFCSPLOWO2_01_FULL_40_42 TaxID=1802066 RepID=A0A1F7J549_9BACT|nr:MAG: DNA protecting protein DprA [Candidatus Roizmanbacteria bacterium RIFCSPLOWO2_01_FULL_40_42]